MLGVVVEGTIVLNRVSRADVYEKMTSEQTET